jgi:hypothetical protein
VSEFRKECDKELEGQLKKIKVVPLSVEDTASEIIAIDGSYAPIFRASNVWIIAVRAVALRYGYSPEEGYAVRDCVINEGANALTTDKRIASEMDELAMGIQSLTAKRVGEAPKRMAALARINKELELVAQMSKRCSDSTIVLDGTLTAPPLKPIRDMLDEAVERSNANNNRLVGLSKDSSLNLFGSEMLDEEILQRVEMNSPGYVVPPQPGKSYLGPKGTTFYVKFYAEAPKWFRTDISGPGSDPRQVLACMSQFARSQISPGYPYPLVEAHKAAVEVRKYPKLYDELLFRVGTELRMSPIELSFGRTNIEGRRRDAFHSYLDLVSKRETA